MSSILPYSINNKQIYLRQMKAPSPFTLFPNELIQHLNNIYWNYQNSNFSYTQLSHRSKYYADTNIACMNIIKTFFKVPENYEIIFMASGEAYPALPFNLLTITQGQALYFVNGDQSAKMFNEGIKHGQNVSKVQSLVQRQKYAKLLKSQSKNIYTCYNYKELFQSGQDLQQLQNHEDNQIIVCDLSYSANIHQVDVSKHGIVFFKSGTSLGVLGTEVLIVRKDLINHHSKNCPDVLDFEYGVRMKSIINTPSTISTLVLKQHLEYLLKNNESQTSINQRLQKQKQALLKQLSDLTNIEIVHSKKELSNSIRFRVISKSKEQGIQEQDWSEYFREDKQNNCWQFIIQEENNKLQVKKLFLHKQKQN